MRLSHISQIFPSIFEHKICFLCGSTSELAIEKCVRVCDKCVCVCVTRYACVCVCWFFDHIADLIIGNYVWLLCLLSEGTTHIIRANKINVYRVRSLFYSISFSLSHFAVFVHILCWFFRPQIINKEPVAQRDRKTERESGLINFSLCSFVCVCD